MNPKFLIKKGENFVHAHVRAPISWELLAELMTKTAGQADEWGFDRYLVDLSRVKKKFGAVEDYDIAYNKAKECGFKIGSKHSLIVRHKDVNEFHFVETVFRNAGYNMKIFTEYDAAYEWITK